MPTKPKILALSDYYLPGYKGGGALRALAHIIGHLKTYFEFVVLAPDTDASDINPYSKDLQTKTQQTEGHTILYVHSFSEMLLTIYRTLRGEWDLIYLNSSFSPKFSLFPLLLRYLGLTKNVPFIVAPRGELLEGALRSKQTKKMWFLRIARGIGLYHGVTFHTTSSEETKELHALRLGKIHVVEVKDLPPARIPSLPSRSPVKEGDLLRLVFISRIDVKKNVLYALELLHHVKGRIEFDIYGPIIDSEYWHECVESINSLPKNIQVRHLGPVAHSEVLATFAQYDLFLFPTLGENNGYAITEAMLAGCPVLISDRTPWRGLEQLGVGYDIPLENHSEFTAVLERWISMPSTEHTLWCNRAQNYALEQMRAEKDVEATKQLLQAAMRH